MVSFIFQTMMLWSEDGALNHFSRKIGILNRPGKIRICDHPTPVGPLVFSTRLEAPVGQRPHPRFALHVPRRGTRCHSHNQ